MQHIIGKTKLAIRSPKTRLAELIMTPSHSEHHCSTPGDALFMSRKHAWIVKDKHLAKMLVRTYQWCRMMSMVPLEQRIGMLLEEKVMVTCVPFTNIMMDLKGPFRVNDMIKQRIGSLLLHEHGSGK